jgi:hypothetical protein
MCALDPNELVAKARHLDEAAFVKANPGVFLVIRGGGDMLAEPGIRTTVRMERPRVAVAPAQSAQFKIIPVASRGTSPFSDAVSLGRASENDIVIQHVTISKVHAFFSEAEPGVWMISDHGSTNGTWIAGVRLKPNEPRKLGPNETLGFGQCQVAFKAAGPLWRFLDLERRTGA